MIELTHVTKSYGSLLLLKDISAVFQGGRVHLITGRNGSGKSTLLRIIGGLAEIDAGTVSFHDENATIGYLGHTTFLYPNLTAVENLAFWQKAYGRRAEADAILAVLKRVGLLPFAYTRSAVFSRGMAQRLSLARILLLEPEILLLDEPETGLDASSRSLLEKEVFSARDKGACILWVSHAAAGQCRADCVFEIRDCSLLETRLPLSSDKEAVRASVRDPLAAGGQNMLSLALAIAKKDLRLAMRSAGLVQSMLLGLLLVFLFSLSQKTGKTVSGQTAAAIFWLSSIFCQTLVFNMLFSYEEANGARTALLLSPCHITGIFLGKALAGLVLILTAQLLFMPAVIVFLGQTMADSVLQGLAMLFVADIGLAALGALLGALSQGQSARESLLSLIVFPMAAPLLLAAIRVFASLFCDAGADNDSTWLQFACAYDAIFLSLSMLLFRFVYTGDD